MPRYAHTGRAPRAMTSAEQAALLRATADHRNGFRAHILYSVALVTGLRQHELLALDCGDLFRPDGSPKGRVPLRVFKRSTDYHAVQEVVIPETLRRKLKRFRAWKRKHDQGTDASDPVFVSRHGLRLSAPRARSAFKRWQERAKFDRTFTFHELRHTACTNLHNETQNLRLVQRFARHVSPDTTAIYTHVSDEDLTRAVERIAGR